MPSLFQLYCNVIFFVMFQIMFKCLPVRFSQVIELKIFKFKAK